MNEPLGDELEKKRIYADGDRAAGVVAALARIQGYALVNSPESADLQVIDAHLPERLQQALQQNCPVVALSERRLRPMEITALREMGAAKVLHGESSVLDVAFVLSDLLFETSHAHRRYARQLGGVPVQFTGVDGDEPSWPTQAQLLGLSRWGAYLQTTARYPARTQLDIAFTVANRKVVLRCRVACLCGDDLMGVEFALDHHEVAPPVGVLSKWSCFASPASASVSA